MLQAVSNRYDGDTDQKAGCAERLAGGVGANRCASTPAGLYGGHHEPRAPRDAKLGAGAARRLTAIGQRRGHFAVAIALARAPQPALQR